VIGVFIVSRGWPHAAGGEAGRYGHSGNGYSKYGAHRVLLGGW
jgi:hypothetical protein